MKIRAIIFSKDRPMQLECLLRSIRENAPDLFDEIYVQYCASNKDFESGYALIYKMLEETVEITFYDKVMMINERFNRFSFKTSFYDIVLVGNIQLITHTCLLVDDDIFFNPVSRSEVEEKLSKSNILSLRLGDNIRNKVHHNYKSSLDGNIFENKIIEKVFDKEFKNPNQLEVALIDICKPYSMSRFNEPKLIGIPANRVSETSGCKYMENNTEDLLRWFNEGKRIDYKKMDFKTDDVHCYVPFHYFEK